MLPSQPKEDRPDADEQPFGHSLLFFQIKPIERGQVHCPTTKGSESDSTAHARSWWLYLPTGELRQVNRRAKRKLPQLQASFWHAG